jgi:hypothetical protein
MVLPKAQSRLATLADSSVRVDAPQGKATLSGATQPYLMDNAYWDGAAYQRYNTALPAAMLTVQAANGVALLYTAPAGANPIAWAGPTSLGGDSGWLAPTYAANWADFGAGRVAGGYRRDALGWVNIEGLAKKGVALALPDTIFTLPVGYRPATGRMFACASTAGYAEVRVETNGTVVLQAGGSATYTSLDGIRFDPAR